MASGKAGGSGGAGVLGVLGLFLYWSYKKLAAMSTVQVVLFILGIIGCFTLIIGISWYFDRTTTETRERTVRRPDRRYNVGYREEQEEYQAIIPLSDYEIERTKRTGLRIILIGLLMILGLSAPWLPFTASAQPKGWRYITTESGMNMRSTPSATGTQLRVIPFKAQVEVLESAHEEVIYGKTAKWLKVKYAGQTGWIWGYFTSSDEP